jgi:hypothetical protein
MSRKYLLCGCLATVLVLGTASISPADAQERNRDRVRDEHGCKNEVVKAAGKATFRPFSHEKEKEGKGQAMQNAITAWQREVLTKYGSSWMVWADAEKPDNYKDCKPAYPGRLGGNFWRCTIQARPCSKPDRPEFSRPEFRESAIEIQRLLRRNGYRIRDDGVWGPETRNALEDFQREHGLPGTGYPDDRTMARLHERRG